MHGSRLNDLAGVAFASNDQIQKIKYILYNPMAVNTPGMKNFSNPLMKIPYKFIGKSIDKAILPIIEHLNNPPTSQITAFKESEQLDLSLATFDPHNVQKLYQITTDLLNSF